MVLVQTLILYLLCAIAVSDARLTFHTSNPILMIFMILGRQGVARQDGPCHLPQSYAVLRYDSCWANPEQILK